MIRIRIAAVAAVVLSVALGGCAPASPEEAFRERLMLADFPQVTYLDEDGNEIGFEAFNSKARAGHRFMMMKDTDTGIALIRLSSAEESAKASANNVDRGTDRISIGDRLPATRGRALDGSNMELAFPSDRPRLLSFFFDQCAPCIAEVPALNAFAASHPDIEVVSITFDSSDAASAFSTEHGLRTAVIADAQVSIDALGVKTYPTMMLVSGNGELLSTRSGGSPDGGDDALLSRTLDLWASRLQGQAHTATSSHGQSASDSPPPFVAQRIAGIKAEPARNPPAKILRYDYYGGEVYYIPPHCCDMTGELFAADGERLCAPDGGITGRGDGRCPDFFETRREETLIWADPRKSGSR